MNRIQSLQAINSVTLETVLDLAYTFMRSYNFSLVTDATSTAGAPIEYRYGYGAASQLVQVDVLMPPVTGTPGLFGRYAYDEQDKRVRARLGEPGAVNTPARQLPAA